MHYVSEQNRPDVSGRLFGADDKSSYLAPGTCSRPARQKEDAIRMNRITAAAIALSIHVSLAAAPVESLLKNGDFAGLAEDMPPHWRIYDTGQHVAVDKEDAPEGCPHSLRVTVASAGSSEGQIVQRITIPEQGSALMLSGALKSTVSQLCYLQVKLYEGGKESKRMVLPERSGTTWKRVSFIFATESAEQLEVLCRWRRKKESVGQTAWFADISLTKAPPARLTCAEATATFGSIGVRTPYDGGVLPGMSCRLSYRAKGEAGWRTGMDLFDCPHDQEYRGSLFGLTPDTAYEVRCRLFAPDTEKPVSETTAAVRTWREGTPVGNVRTLPPESTEPLVIRDKGAADAWIVYRPESADAVLDAGADADHAILVEGAEYVVIERLTVRGGMKDCVRISQSNHIVVRRCDIAGWGDAGVRKDGLPKGLYVDKNGRTINFQAGVRVANGSSQVVIEDNYIHDPRGTANSWEFGHPMGPEGVLLDRTGGNHVVRNNDIVGSEAHWWNDAIESISNGEVTGGPYRDTDIHGNVLVFSNDDGVELDGGQINVRFYENWICWALCGVSCAPNRSGPSYVFRNLIAGLGEERMSGGSAFKMGGNQLSPGMNAILHNTIYGRGGGLRSVGFGSGKDRGAYIAFSRNNVFAGPGHADVTNVSKSSRNSFDYDLTSRGGVSLTCGGEEHAVSDMPVFEAPESGDFRLKPGSPGIDQGVRLAGLNDDFLGDAPDMGALESGKSTTGAFPVRPSGMSATPTHASLAHWPGTRDARVEIMLTVPPSAGARWRAHVNAPWLTCSPAEGSCSDKPQTVVVTMSEQNPECRLHRGAVTFRTDLGLNCTALADFKVYPSPPFVAEFEAEAATLIGSFRRVTDPSASGSVYIDTPDAEDPEEGRAEFAFDVPREDTYYVVGRCMMPTPDSGLHDSFRFSMDGEEPRIWGYRLAEDTWGWTLLNARGENGPCKFTLRPGRHVLTILSRETLSRLDRLAITNSPYPEEPLNTER